MAQLSRWSKQSPPIGITYAAEFGTPDELLVFFWIFLFRAAAATMQRELVVATARAAIAKTENFMVGAVGYVGVLLIIRSTIVTILCLFLRSIILIYLHYCSAKIELLIQV